MLKNYTYVISWALLIAVLSFLPGPSFPKTELTRADLAVHFFFYATLTYLWLGGTYKNNEGKSVTLNQYVIIIISTISYSGLVELIQGTEFVSRSCELSDFIANSIGSIIGAFIFIVQPTKIRLLWSTKNTLRNNLKNDPNRPSL